MWSGGCVSECGQVGVSVSVVRWVYWWECGQVGVSVSEYTRVCQGL